MGTPVKASKKIDPKLNALSILKQLNDKTQARSLDKQKKKTSVTKDQKKRYNLKSEEKDPKTHVIPPNLDGKQSKGKNTYNLRNISKDNPVYRMLLKEHEENPDAKNQQNLLKQYFKAWDDSDHVEYFTFKTNQSFYKMGEIIGKGCFGKVYKAVQVLTGHQVALKVIPKVDIKNKNAKKKIEKEFAILKRLNNEAGISKLFEVFEDEENVYLVFQYLKNGDLIRYFDKNELLEEERLRPFFQKIVQAVQSMHANEVIHRDIKLDNILLDGNFDPKLCDFGISNIVEPNQPIMDTGGTPAYLAPEVILNEGKVCYKSDVWSLGILLYLLVYGHVPFKSKEVQSLYQKIITGKYSFPAEEVNPDITHLISQMLVINIDERYSVQDVLNHRWFAPLNSHLRKHPISTDSSS